MQCVKKQKTLHFSEKNIIFATALPIFALGQHGRNLYYFMPLLL